MTPTREVHRGRGVNRCSDVKSFRRAIYRRCFHCSVVWTSLESVRTEALEVPQP